MKTAKLKSLKDDSNLIRQQLFVDEMEKASIKIEAAT